MGGGKKKLTAISALMVGLTALSGFSTAKASEFSISVGPQREQFSGWVKYKGTEVDVKDDLHIEDKTKFHATINWKNEIKYVPNIRVDYLRVKTSGEGTLSKTVTFGGVTFNVSDRVSTDLKTDQIDATFYYEPVKTEAVNIEAGLGVKYLTGHVEIRSLTTGAYSKTDYDIPVPYVYAALNGKISHFIWGIEGKGITYSGSYLYDLRIKGGVEVGRVFANVGYRFERLKIDDVDDFSTDVRLKGVYGEVGIRF